MRIRLVIYLLLLFNLDLLARPIKRSQLAIYKHNFKTLQNSKDINSKTKHSNQHKKNATKTKAIKKSPKAKKLK